MKLYFKSNERLKKIFNYFSIFTIVFGTTFGSLNSVSYADDTDVLTIGTGADITKTSAATSNGDTGNAITTGDMDIILDATNDLTSDVAIGIDTITTVDDTTADVFNLLLDGVALTVDETVTSRDDTLTINIGNGTLVSELNIVGAATGADVGDLIIDSKDASTLTLSGGTTGSAIAHSATIKGAGTLKVTGVVTNDESIGEGSNNEIGILDIDGTFTSTSTIESLVLDLDGTLSGATSLVNTNASTLGGSITTTGVTTLTGAATLDGNTDITTTNAVVQFGSTVNGDGIDLTIDSGTAATNFDGVVGGTAGVGAITLTGALDLDAAITDAESISVSLASNLGASITTTGTAATTITLSDAATLSAATTLTTANTNISLEAVDGANTLTLVAGTGNITTSAAMTDVTTLTVTSATTASFAATTNATSTVLNSSGSNTFNSTLTSPIVDINAGTTTFSGVVTAATRVDVAGANTIVNIDAAPDTGQLNLDAGTVNISVKEVDIDDLDMDGGTIVIEKTVVNNDSVFLVSSQTSAGVGSAGTIIMPVNLSNNQVLTLFNDAGTIDTTIASVEAVVADTALTNYTASISSGDLLVTSVDKSSSTTASELGVTENDANALLQLRNAAINDTNVDGGAEDAVFNALNARGGFSATEDTSLAKQAAPQTDMISGSTFATKAMTGSLQGIMSNRMASLRSGDAFYGSGMSAGSSSANSAFLQVFGSVVEQGNTTVGSGTQFGYDANSSGIAFGTDYITDTGSVVGLSLSASETEVDGNGTGNSENNIDSYTASIYVDKSTDTGYVEGSLTIGRNENTTSRIVNTAGLDRTYTGSYDSNQASLKIGAGKANAVGTGYVTPFGSVTHTKISIDAYTETSTTANDNLRLRVAQDDVNSTVGTVGLKYHNILDNGGSPMISLAVNKEFGDEAINSTNTYQGGGTAFTTSTDVEDMSATLGLGYSYSSDGGSIEFAYEADANDDDYLSHYGSIKFNKKF